MPTIFSAKDIAEEALKEIGRFPTNQSQADAKDMQRTLRRLEMVLNDHFGGNSVTSAQGTLRIPLVASTLKYALVNYATQDGVQFAWAAELVKIGANGHGSPRPIQIVTEQEFYTFDLSTTGEPEAICIDKGVKGEPPYMQVHPILGDDVPQETYEILLQVQTFAPLVSTRGLGASPDRFFIRPTYYLWAVTKLAYFIGRGAVRRLPDNELSRLQKDYMDMETKLSGFDASENSTQHTTDPWGQ